MGVTTNMASRFFQCVCGDFATIDMFAWLSGLRAIECKCGRKLKILNMLSAHYAWARQVQEMCQRCKDEQNKETT